MRLVLDASAAVRLVLRGEQSARLLAALDKAAVVTVRVVSEIDGGMFTIGDGPWTRLTAALAPR